MSKDVCERGLYSCLPERVVQAIRGFLLGFRRGDSVASKTRAIGKTKCAVLPAGDSSGVCVRTEN
jgi:hypothetical protein